MVFEELPPVLMNRTLARGYGRKPIPNELDAQILGVVALIEDGEAFEEARNRIVENDTGIVLAAFAERMASMGIRNNDPDVIALGLRALAVGANSVGDAREILPVAGLLYRAFQIVDVNPGPEFSRVMQIADSSTVRLFASFIARTDLARIVDAMGYDEATDAGGFCFVRRW